jgi:hypothetical protein
MVMVVVVVVVVHPLQYPLAVVVVVVPLTCLVLVRDPTFLYPFLIPLSTQLLGQHLSLLAGKCFRFSLQFLVAIAVHIRFFPCDRVL